MGWTTRQDPSPAVEALGEDASPSAGGSDSPLCKAWPAPSKGMETERTVNPGMCSLVPIVGIILNSAKCKYDGCIFKSKNQTDAMMMIMQHIWNYSVWGHSGHLVTTHREDRENYREEKGLKLPRCKTLGWGAVRACRSSCLFPYLGETEAEFSFSLEAFWRIVTSCSRGATDIIRGIATFGRL